MAEGQRQKEAVPQVYFVPFEFESLKCATKSKKRQREKTLNLKRKSSIKEIFVQKLKTQNIKQINFKNVINGVTEFG